jgi:alkanesulfonate monooxygenase SsuD/methylene tetrahydromethanopterin reductase-like flavin-dependent oxidoreductase (luciferase family)
METPDGRQWRRDAGMTTLGAVCLPQVPPERLRNAAAAADEAGLDELWLWEDCFWGGAVPACAAALAWTTRVHVAIGILPVPLRNVATAAMDAAMLYRLFPGRVTIGVGHGVQDWMRQVGAEAESPMGLLREYLDALRALLAGERLTVGGRYVRLDDVAVNWPPPVPPPVLLGAIGPRTIRLAGEAADGTVLTQGGADGVRRARELIDEGRAAAGRTDAHRLVAYLETEGRDAAAAAADVQALAAAGAETVVLYPPRDGPAAADPAGFVRFAASEVRPLLLRPGPRRAELESGRHAGAADEHRDPGDARRRDGEDTEPVCAVAVAGHVAPRFVVGHLEARSWPASRSAVSRRSAAPSPGSRPRRPRQLRAGTRSGVAAVRSPGARISVTATDVAAITVIPSAGDVNSATVPAMAAPTPCIASMHERCSPSACPLSSSGVSAISRCCSIRVAE